MTSKKNEPTVYQLKITLRYIKPPIWRRVQVQSSTTLSHLHLIIQAAMGWYNCHLHQFSIQGIEYGQLEPNYGFEDEELRDEKLVQLNQVVKQEKSKFFYTYDFGDDWSHEILVEKILPQDPEISYPLCLKAKRACPPEDCGGPWGYAEFLEAIQNPQHSEHENLLEWIGGDFNSEASDLNKINRRLSDPEIFLYEQDF
ncbi:MAG: plasmid pRiA4b ORF-3 family protein [Prochloraceae cyanobacterium]|nr:plasmid pRiA4b ORF-3 family protein [Prochloraceae cyanobacterium]